MTAEIRCAPCLTRRRFLRHGGFLTLAGLLPGAALGSIAARGDAEKSLSFYNTHTGEKLNAVYWAAGYYFPDSLAEINFLLRDHRADETRPIAPQLLDLVYDLNRVLQNSAPIHIISGYRSAATNAALAARSGGVARHSLHVEGKAIDLSIPGRDLPEVRRAALALQAGGVGYYPRSGFVHVDIGRVRTW
jgi:uncharacterized protein YcbK (DUF882 family)